MIPSIRAQTKEADKMDAEQITRTLDSWIVEEDLPVKHGLKVIRRNDPDCGFTDDEISDRNEFIRCYLLKEHEALMQIAEQDDGRDFFVSDFEESAFNTVDFWRTLPKNSFRKYAYRIQKIMEQVKDLAIMHSSISSEEGRQNTHKRYQALLDLSLIHI